MARRRRSLLGRRPDTGHEEEPPLDVEGTEPEPLAEPEPVPVEPAEPTAEPTAEPVAEPEPEPEPEPVHVEPAAESEPVHVEPVAESVEREKKPGRTIPADRLPPVYTPRDRMLTRGGTRRRRPRRPSPREVAGEQFLVQLALTFAIIGSLSFGVGAAGLFVLRGEVFRLLGW